MGFTPKLPARQQEALRLIRDAISADETPTHSWLAQMMGCSRGTAQRFIESLRLKGYLECPQWVGEWKVLDPEAPAKKKRARA